MVLNTREIVEIMAYLARQENIRVNITQSFRAAAIGGTFILLGGIFLGPIGIVAVGIPGCVFAYSTSSDFRPIAEILMYDLTSAQQAQLVNRVNNVIRSIDAADVLTVTALIASRHSLRENLLSILKHFITSDLNYSLA